MNRTGIFVYGVVSYLIFFLTYLYAIGFVGNFGVPRTLDGPASGSMVGAAIINLILLSIFAVQHSVMARPEFKKWWITKIPLQAERSTYVLLSSLALILLFLFWQPMGGSIWSIDNSLGRGILYGLFGFGWALVLVSTFLTNHFELFGLRQVWLCFRGEPYTPLPFGTPWLYQYVRHPLYVGWFFAFWATPDMTVTHLLFAVVTSIYILLAIQWEERDLCAVFPEYEDYRKRVPMMIPKFSGTSADDSGA